MNREPPAELRLDPASHRSALWGLALVYRKPRHFEDTVGGLSRRDSARTFAVLYLHGLLYLLLTCGLGRWFLVESRVTLSYGMRTEIVFLGGGLALAALVGVVLSWISGHTTLSLAYGLTIGLFLGAALGHVKDLALDPVGNLSFGIVSGLAYGVFSAFLSPVARIASGLGLGLTFGVLGGVTLRAVLGFYLFAGFVIGHFRLPSYLFHLFWIWPRIRGTWYRWHPVAWDDVCSLPFPRLTLLLVDYAESSSDSAELEIARLLEGNPAQRRSALHARCILVARRAAGVRNLAHLDAALADLPEGRDGLLAKMADLRWDAHEISVNQARLDAQHRPFLREAYASFLVKSVESFKRESAHLERPFATEFRTAAGTWLGIAQDQLEKARGELAREPVPQVFHAGDPVDRNRGAYVHRDRVAAALERQILREDGCPALIVYGRRRTGKSTLLRNLGSFLPRQVEVVSASMQRARAVAGLGTFLQLVLDLVPESLGVPSAKGIRDLTDFEEALTALDAHLVASDRRVLIALDEYENLDRKIGEGVLPEDLLGVIRESIQTHRGIVWMFAGSHDVAELRHAPWTSYLVSARTVEVPLFTPPESRLLLTEPFHSSELWDADAAGRPHFEPGFWGEGGIELLHVETAGWPHLLQLVAETVVDQVNDAGCRHTDAEMLEQSLHLAVTSGDTVFRELLERESRIAGEWEYLLGFRDRDSQPPPTEAAVAQSLRRRLLVMETEDGWRLKVPLMARWLRSRL